MTLRQVGDCGLETLRPPPPNPVLRGPRALRPVADRPSAHGARLRWRTWHGYSRGQRGMRFTSHRRPRIFFTDTATGRRMRLQTNIAETYGSRAARSRAFRPVADRPSAHGARSRWRSWRGCLRGQCGVRSTPHRWPRLFFTDITPGRRLRCRNAVTKAFEKSRGARPARASSIGEPADRPQSTCALADLAWLSLRPTRGALQPTPLVEALLHRHCTRPAAVASIRRNRSCRIPWRAARARFAPWRTG